MIAIVHSIYSQSVHAPARDAGLMDNDAERYCMLPQANDPDTAHTSPGHAPVSSSHCTSGEQ